MQILLRLRFALRGTALAVLLAGLGLWGATGARLGWTQTSAIRLQTDAVTGIEYPVREPKFVAGVEVPLLTAALAAGFAGLSLFPRRPARVRA
jgi:hypothetical protein